MKSNGGRCSKCKQPVTGGHNATTCGRSRTSTQPQASVLPTLTLTSSASLRPSTPLATPAVAYNKYLDRTSGTPRQDTQETHPKAPSPATEAESTPAAPTSASERASELRESAVDRLSNRFTSGPSDILDILRAPNCPPQMLEVYESVPAISGII